MEDDVIGELTQVFDQVSIDKWIDKIGDCTFKTEKFLLSNTEAVALLRKNRAVRGELPEASEETNETIKSLTSRVHDFLEKNYKNGEGKIFVFAKLSDRSPKDSKILQKKIETFYNEKLPQIPNVFFIFRLIFIESNN